MLEAANGPESKNSGYNGGNTGVDADFGARREGVETMGDGLGGWGGEGFGGCGVAAGDMLVGGC